jgi:hypothetical protein
MNIRRRALAFRREQELVSRPSFWVQISLVTQSWLLLIRRSPRYEYCESPQFERSCACGCEGHTHPSRWDQLGADRWRMVARDYMGDNATFEREVW